ncbi:zinc-ribbon domain-containing protein [Geobacter pelophilus]|uniref:Zinc-ribbon domain-containing protein n=1 Tax=Geoanaerobacter pelophilus TaxID=60036 RepID=A0AAW4L3K1_9BACT|nr:DUF3426 domain-containing protein [Geoanaerobacter pelophilus]MBT0662811.1 zinc-ribbon domain-containing protein [Geoanaerobacter pelophilus]
MIIQCELCSTRFKLDDTKVKDEGVRVRCSKCRHIFVVRKEKADSADDSDFDTLLNGLVSASPQESDLLSGESPSQIDNQSVSDTLETTAFAAGFDSDSNQGSITLSDGKSIQNDCESTDCNSEMQPYYGEKADFSFDFSGDTFEENGLGASEDTESDLTAVPEKKEVDFSSGLTAEAAVPFNVDEQPKEAIVANDKEEPVSGGLLKESDQAFTSGISWDSPFTEVSEGNETLSPIQSEGQEAESFNSNNMVGQPSVHLTTVPEISADEMPPAAIATRRLGRSRFPLVVVSVSILIVIVLTISGLYLLNKGPGFIDKSGLASLVKWAGIENVDDGGISIRNTSSEFIDNKETGELFVIKGETVNLFNKPRASIQLKATIYDAKGVALASKSIYCGNVLQKDQLATLSMPKIEATMGNQFGDSLSNLGVPPGKAIPFLVVFSKVPKAASEFGLEIVGSTVADR